MGNQRAEAACPPNIGGANPPDVVPCGQGRKEGVPVITYEEFFLFCTFIVALVGLCHQIFRDRK